ncbi:Protein of unknown function (DUF2974) [Ruminococcaceae bacterium R-25]|nr:Protein of unknown function (DUF2974) [Ruminococcaceae bacterium R-25]SUQ22503.1 Protein of unknown function [Oscillospiraceae bacterium]
MGNLLDYLAWRGDLPFSRDPFNSIDACLLSSLSYIDFTDIVPGKGKGKVTMREASKQFFKLHSAEELSNDKSFINFCPSILKALAESNRFRGAMLSNFVDDTDIGREIQFGALEIETSDGVAFISFRGTDDRIIGWKEDFNLSYMTVPAETEAVLYMQEVMGGRTQEIRMGGHSKGGHLAIYAATQTLPEIAQRIKNIYSFDGPGFGFNKEILETPQFTFIEQKIEKFIPQTSIVGRLLTSSVRPMVIRSNEHGIMQHNPLSWEVEGKEFYELASTDKVSDTFEETLSSWLDEMSFLQRKVFVDDLFSVFEASGADTMSSMTKVGIKGTRAMITRMKEINDSSGRVRTLVKLFFVNLDVVKEGKEALADKKDALVDKIKKTGKK